MSDAPVFSSKRAVDHRTRVRLQNIRKAEMHALATRDGAAAGIGLRDARITAPGAAGSIRERVR
jgi:hypothetical protein